MFRKNVVLIKKKRKGLSKNKRERIMTFFRSFYMVSLILITIIGLLYLSARVDEQSKLIGFGTKENAIEIQEDNTNYVMSFFSNKIEIPIDKAKETISSITDFVVCFVSPIVRILSQGIAFLIA